jgi:hypothetical protein
MRVITAFPCQLIWEEGKLDVRVGGKTFEVYFKRHYRREGDKIPNPGWSPGIAETSNVEIPHDRTARVAYTVADIRFPMRVGAEDDEEEQKEVRRWIHAVINRLLEVYRFTEGEFHVDTIPMNELWEYEVQTWADSDEGSHAPSTIEGKRFYPPLVGMRLARIAPVPDVARRLLADGEQLPVPQVLLLNARREALLENYRLAVVEAETAFEALVDQAVSQYYRSKGSSPDEIGKKLEAGLKNLIRDHLPRVCGGKFEGTKAHQTWQRDLYGLRNDVVHNGARAGREQAEKAIEAADKALRWVETTRLRQLVWLYYAAYYDALRHRLPNYTSDPDSAPYFLKPRKRRISVIECSDGYLILHYADPENVHGTNTPESFELVTAYGDRTVGELTGLSYGSSAEFLAMMIPTVQEAETGKYVEPYADSWHRRDALSNAHVARLTEEEARKEAERHLQHYLG